ncbi:MAG: phosphatidylserine decarboxylase [Clostridia bacterium]|nr:phosphatidylserine decarboxylase [Clostridia bacterium]
MIKFFQKAGLFSFASFLMKTRLSKCWVPKYIENNHIDMSEFEGMEFNSFAEFFGRKRENIPFDMRKNVLASPCDSLLSVFEITEDMNIPMKGSHYRFEDIIPNKKTAEKYNGGMCLVFRLQASDYHHFCAFDNLELKETHYIPGLLHSVQPIAIESCPVYRLNRRWWSVIETENFGEVLQVEIGAMMVGGVTFARDKGSFTKGEEFGNFELCGSTIVLIVSKEFKEKFRFYDKFLKAESEEVAIKIGEGLGEINSQTN